MQYKEAINKITGDIDNGLRKYELTRVEWKIIDQLKGVLEVRASCSSACIILTLGDPSLFSDFQGRH